MCGRATLATEESSTTMKVAIITDAAIHPRICLGLPGVLFGLRKAPYILEVLIRCLSLSFRGWLPAA